MSYHIREAVQDPNGRHQVQVDLPHQLLLRFSLFLEGRRGNLDGPFLLRFGRGMSYIMSLLIHSGDAADSLDFSLPEVAVRVFGLRRHRIGKSRELWRNDALSVRELWGMKQQGTALIMLYVHVSSTFTVL